MSWHYRIRQAHDPIWKSFDRRVCVRESPIRSSACRVIPNAPKLQEQLHIKTAQKELLEKDIRRIQEAQSLEGRDVQQGIIEQGRQTSACKEQVIRILISLGVRGQLASSDLLLFNATGEKVEQVMEQILAMASGKSFFRDFSPGALITPQKIYQVSVYLGPTESHLIHWDVVSVLTSKKSHLLKMIQQGNSQLMYQSLDCMVFSNTQAQVEEFRRRMGALGISFDEFGSLGTVEKVLVSKPVVVSICFLN